MVCEENCDFGCNYSGCSSGIYSSDPTEKDTDVSGNSKYVVDFLSGNGIWFYSIFTRTATTRQYELVPFLAWREIIIHYDKFLLQEILLNCILLMPVGILLPVITGYKVRCGTALVIGFLISAVIETSQLIFMRGLLEWDG